jgi:Na+-transporting NADH:ubiquinone oxidoreductase subunit A
VFADAPEPARVVLETAEFPGIKPKVLVKEGDLGEDRPAGVPRQDDRDIVWCSPVTGKVARIDFGERRFLLRIVIENAAAGGAAEAFAELPKPAGDRDALIKAIKNAGLWPLFRQRPGGKMPRSNKVPVAIYCQRHGYRAAWRRIRRLRCRAGRQDLQAGIDLLKKLTPGKVYLTLRAAGDHQSDLRDLKGVEVHDFQGPHPSGLVGTHISRIQPMKLGETCWALRLQDVARLGEWARTGKYPAKTVVAVAGSAAAGSQVLPRAPECRSECAERRQGHRRRRAHHRRHRAARQCRGRRRGLSSRCTTLTVIPEGTDQRDLFGWALPQFGKLSFSRSVFSWLAPKKEYVSTRASTVATARS